MSGGGIKRIVFLKLIINCSKMGDEPQPLAATALAKKEVRYCLSEISLHN